jgi:hypothetical protein
MSYDLCTYQEFVLADKFSKINLLEISVINSIIFSDNINTDDEKSNTKSSSVNSKYTHVNNYLDRIGSEVDKLSINVGYLTGDSVRQIFLLLIINIPLWILVIILIVFMYLK